MATPLFFRGFIWDSLLRSILSPSWTHLGAVLGPSWGHLGLSWACLGPSWAHLGPILGLLGLFLGLALPLLGHVGLSCDYWGLLGHLSGRLGLTSSDL